MKLKKILATLLAVAMVLGTMGTVAFADDTTEIYINNLEELKAFRDDVNDGNNYAGKTVYLNEDIDLAIDVDDNGNQKSWTPIGTEAAKFEGIFDGGGNTISNLIVTGPDSSYLGLFGYAANAEIKNVNIVNVTASGKSYVAAVAGMAYTGTIDNCHVSGEIQIKGNYCVGGIAGAWYANVTNSSVIGDDVNTSYIKGIYTTGTNLEGDNVAGIMANCAERRKVTGCSVKDITIVGTRKVGAIIGSADRASVLTNCSAENVVIGTNATADYANSNSSSMTIGGLIGHYFGDGTGGKVTNCTVKNVTFTNENNVSVNAGPIVGGNRKTPNEEFTGVTSTGNIVYMSTITGSTNTYLMTAVAKIGETNYYELQEAIDAAKAGETVKLLSDITLKNTVSIKNGEKIILDLNGYTIDFDDEVWVYGAANSGTAVLTVDFGGELTINDSSEAQTGTIDGYDENAKNSPNEYKVYGAVMMTAAGDDSTNGTAKLTVNSGTLIGTFAAIGGNRLRDNTEIVINGGTIKCGISEGYSSVGIDHPQNGSLTINGGYIEGMDGISLRSGTLLITGGTIVGNAPESAFEDDGYWDNNFGTCTGHALQIVSRANSEATQEPPSVSITGGTFVSEDTGAVGSYAGYRGATKDTQITGFISGGTFSSDVSEYLADGYEITENDGTYTVATAPVATAPNATVSLLEPMILTPAEHNYMVLPSGDANIDRPLEVVMNFKANDTLAQAQASPYGKWKVDFYLTVTGTKTGSLTANNCYLAGNYGTYGWIVIPTDGLELQDGVSYPVVSDYDANLTYENICDYVKDFTAAIHIDEAILTANPDFTVTLELKMTNPDNANDVYVVGEPAVYTVADLLPKATWKWDTDAGAYKDGEITYGMMRYLFNVDFNVAFTETGIKYIKADDITEPVNATGVSGTDSAFYGDIIKIPDDTDTNKTYYAKAYVKVGSGDNAKWYWSEAVPCSPNFERIFSDYMGGNN